MQVRYQTAPRPDRGCKFNEIYRRRGVIWRRLSNERLAPQKFENVLEFDANLFNDLLALARVVARFVTR